MAGKCHYCEREYQKKLNFQILDEAGENVNCFVLQFQLVFMQQIDSFILPIRYEEKNFVWQTE